MKHGVQDGKLAPCPASPNCVSTQATDGKQQIAPLKFQGSPQEAKQALLSVIQSFPRTRVLKDSEDYIHVTFTSRVFRFVDDVEFLMNPKDGVIEFRSASRVGYSDLGANRKRMEAIRNEFNRAIGKSSAARSGN